MFKLKAIKSGLLLAMALAGFGFAAAQQAEAWYAGNWHGRYNNYVPASYYPVYSTTVSYYYPYYGNYNYGYNSYPVYGSYHGGRCGYSYTVPYSGYTGLGYGYPYYNGYGSYTGYNTAAYGAGNFSSNIIVY